LVLLELFDDGRALALQGGIGKSDGWICEGREPCDTGLECSVAAHVQQAAPPSLGDLQGNKHTLVLHSPGDVQSIAIVSDGRIGRAVDNHASLGHAVGRQRPPALARSEASRRPRIGPCPVSQRRQRLAVAGQRLGLQPLEPTHGAAAGPQQRTRRFVGRKDLTHSSLLRAGVDRAHCGAGPARRRQLDQPAVNLRLCLERGQLRANLVGQGGRGRRAYGVTGRLLCLVAGVQVLGVDPWRPIAPLRGRWAIGLRCGGPNADRGRVWP